MFIENIFLKGSRVDCELLQMPITVQIGLIETCSTEQGAEQLLIFYISILVSYFPVVLLLICFICKYFD